MCSQAGLVFSSESKTSFFVLDLPLTSLSSDAPQYDRKWKKNSNKKKISLPKNFKSNKILESLKKILSSPNNSEKSWVWEQYDHTVMGDTIQKPGGDSAVIRIHGKNKGIAVTVDSSAHYCLSDPIIGAKQVVSETWRNLIAVGATPLAITNCLNFGNPEKEKIMGQFVETIDGISQACNYLDFPVVSGNVSFYNQTKNKSISPTPTIGGVGLIKNLENMMTKNFKEVGSYVIVIGKTLGHLYQSEFFREVLNFKEGPPPQVNLFNEKNNGLLIKNLISKKLINSAHDVSAGGIIVCLVEMCLSTKIGVKIKMPQNNLDSHQYLFSEDQSRYIIEVSEKKKAELCKILEKNSIFYDIIGKTQKDYLDLHKEFNVKISDLEKVNSAWFKKFLN